MPVKKIYWFYFGGTILLLVAIFAFIFWPTAPSSVERAAGKLTGKEQRAATGDQKRELRAADQKRAAADRATTNAELLMQQGNTSAQQAAALRLQSHTHHVNPAPTSDSAVLRLERRWADWRP